MVKAAFLRWQQESGKESETEREGGRWRWNWFAAPWSPEEYTRGWWRFGGDGRRFSSPTASAMVELPTPAAMENGGRCRSVVPHEQERPGMGIAAVVGCGSGREGGEGRRWQR
ncbi:hypothetical protein LXL04_033577 [Taraxacum kok-saghyz]